MRPIIAIVLFCSSLCCLSACLSTAPCEGSNYCSPILECGSRYRAITGAALAPADDGGVYSLSRETGMASSAIVRRFDVNGRLAWDLPMRLADDGYERLFAVAESLYMINAANSIAVIRDGALVQRVSLPLPCYVRKASAERGSLRVIGATTASQGCSYLVTNRGDITDVQLLGSHGEYDGITVASGGYAMISNDALFRYDDRGQLLWQRAVPSPQGVIESSGAFFVYSRLERLSQLLRIAADGQSQTVIASWPASDAYPQNHERDLRGFVSVADGVLMVLQPAVRPLTYLLVRTDATTLQWQKSIEPASLGKVGYLSASSDQLVLSAVEEEELAAFDLDGNLRFKRAAPFTFAVGADGATRVFERERVDPRCAVRARITTLDAAGAIRWTWTP